MSQKAALGCPQEKCWIADGAFGKVISITKKVTICKDT